MSKLASLSSTLLARKGTARPAMRPQGFGGFGAIPSAVDDLGWNDMGDSGGDAGGDAGGEPHAAPVPPVLVQREARVEEFSAPAVDEARPRVSVATATRIRRETQTKHKHHPRSAFTLRLDTDRHLKLRLASALNNRSAQLIVTEALDAFLANQPEVEALLSQLPAGTRKGS